MRAEGTVDEQMSDVLSKVSASLDESASSAKSSRLMELFLPPPNVVPLRIRQRTGSVVQPGQPDYEPNHGAAKEAAEEEPAEELAAMLKSTKWTMRLLRETRQAE